MAAIRAVAMLATAPKPASIADQTRRFTMSCCIAGGLYPDSGSGPRRRSCGGLGVLAVQAAADRLHDEPLGVVEIRLLLGKGVEDPAREHLLDRPVERHRGELRRHVVAELARYLGLVDDRGDQAVGLADLGQVGLAE